MKTCTGGILVFIPFLFFYLRPLTASCAVHWVNTKLFLLHNSYFFVFQRRLRKMEDRCRALETDKEAILASNAAVRVHAVLILWHGRVV